MMVSQMRHVHELESLLKKEGRIRLASGLWARYMRGEVIPQGALHGAANSLVNRIGKVFPQTPSVFYTPLWGLLDWNSQIDLEEIRSIYLSLDEEIHIHFVRRIDIRGERAVSDKGMFWHLKKSIEARRALLTELGVWDCLIVCLLEARMNYAAQSIEAFFDCQLLACRCLEQLQEFPEFQIKRLRGILLTMEALCFDALIEAMGEDPVGNSALKSGDRYWITMRSWSERCQRHVSDLSTNSRRSFLRILKEGTIIGSTFRIHSPSGR